MTKPILYYTPLSPASRFALITAKMIGLDVDIKRIDLSKGEHFFPEFKAINPTSTVPALVDGDTKIFDSNAIAIYMVEKYAKDDSLYPKDLNLRTKVNERLFYIASCFFPRGYEVFWPVFMGRESKIPDHKKDEVWRGYASVEAFLDGSDYLAGSSLTLCDLALWPMVETGSQVIPIDGDKFPSFTRWLSMMRELPTYQLNKEGADLHVDNFRRCLERNIAQLNKAGNKY